MGRYRACRAISDGAWNRQGDSLGREFVFGAAEHDGFTSGWRLGRSRRDSRVGGSVIAGIDCVCQARAGDGSDGG